MRFCQHVAAFMEGWHLWQVLLAVIRLPQYKADLVVTLNSLVAIAQYELPKGHKRAKYTRPNAKAPDLFRAMVSSLDIRDYGLFGT